MGKRYSANLIDWPRRRRFRDPFFVFGASGDRTRRRSRADLPGLHVTAVPADRPRLRAERTLGRPGCS